MKTSPFLLLSIFIFFLHDASLGASQETNAPTPGRPQQVFEQAKLEHQLRPDDPDAAWRFARACFDLADDAAKKTTRAEMAQQGINVCVGALAKASNSAPLHYYLGLNQGQLARTRSLGALKLVGEMEVELTKAAALDASFDFGGPDRSLGLLYRNAPAWAGIGDRTKARQHLRRALELAPDFPENGLNLIESELKWGDRNGARQDLKQLLGAWAPARSKFTGPAWNSSWPNWEERLENIKQKLDITSTRAESSKH